VFGRGQTADGIVVVDAGATWREVLAATLPRGWRRPGSPTTSTCRSAAR
jgi:FAD/FMN-containing dehydrogenase